MVDALIDTMTVVDLLRAYPLAVTWFGAQSQKFGVTKFVWMEIIQGCTNKSDLRKSIRRLEHFTLVQTEIEDIDWALDKLTRFHLSHNVDIMDCLIAATAQRLQIPLYTRNVKHFKPLIGGLCQKPY